MPLAVNSIVRWLFESKGFHRVIAGYMPKNKRSERVLEKCGFEQEGLAKAYLLAVKLYLLASLLNDFQSQGCPA